ncbi:MAG TPA: endo-1,4-beta-xylanase [Polyangia bacterium]|nr:endo-1,4-beta-xylanase [Polyangia bacterium]
MRQTLRSWGAAAAGAVFFMFATGCSSGESNSPAGTAGAPGSGGGPDVGSGGSDAPGSGGSRPATGGRPGAGGGGSGGAVGAGGRGASGGSAGARAGSGGAAGGRGGSAGAPARGGSAGTAGPYTVEFVGNITTNEQVDTNGKTFSKYWDQISPENAGKWGSVQSTAGGSFNWKTLDAIHDYAQKNNVIFKEHNFIWGSQQPGGTIGQAQVQAWMTAFCQRYPDTKLIDVVNEPPPHTTPSYANNIGGGTNGDWKWIANAFTWARAACPDATLILNDYNNIEWSNDQSHFISIVKAIQALNAPIDAVGAQAHDLDHGSPVTPTLVSSMLATLAKQTGLPIYITELDLSYTDDNQQLQAYQSYFPLLRDSGYVKGITIWGWIYGSTWSQAPNSGLIKSGTFRPAMTWLMQQLGRPTN